MEEEAQLEKRKDEEGGGERRESEKDTGEE